MAVSATSTVITPHCRVQQNQALLRKSETVANQAEETLRAKLAILEQQLAKTPYFGGDRWDMADFMVACVLYVLARLKLDPRGLPETRGLANRKHQ